MTLEGKKKPSPWNVEKVTSGTGIRPEHSSQTSCLSSPHRMSHKGYVILRSLSGVSQVVCMVAMLYSNSTMDGVGGALLSCPHTLSTGTVLSSAFSENP